MTPPASTAPSLFSGPAPETSAPTATSPAQIAAVVSDSKFADLKNKLRELFELDKSDLDFGIYRIMAAKNKEVTEFLDRQLKEVVRETLAAHGAGAADQVQAELEKVIAGLKAGEMSDEEIAANKKVVDLRKRVAAAGGASAAELEADIYNHLLAFFGRYYDEGDFISKRRYKGDTYAIPYAGEEVTLHWANKDQYYIKSGEWHKDYRFKVGGGRTVRFKLVEATQEGGGGNNKERDDAKRRYVLAEENPVEESGSELMLRFEFRTPTEAEKTRAADKAVAIFGGKYATSTKGDEREQFCADAEKRALASMSPAWASAVTQVVAEGNGKTATETKPQRALLGKHLDEFTARNTFDYFIHKDLGGFLRRELDFYIKNEVVRLDDLETLPGDHLARVQGKVKAIRRVAGRIIDFLASIENFQKKIWLKKKLVLETNWLVTVDRISPALRDVVAANAKQWEEWEKLGFKPQAGAEVLIQGAKWRTREYLDANDKLVVDTAFFGRQWLAELVASDGIFADSGSDDAAVGLLINGENYHAISIIQSRFKRKVQCVYIDPPYNTGGDGFLYRDSYQHSSWLSSIDQLACASRWLCDEDSSFFASIDENEADRLMLALQSNYFWAGTIVVQNNPKGRYMDRHLSTSHEYLLCYVGDDSHVLAGIPKPQEQLDAQFTERDARGPYRLLELRNTHREFGKHNRPNLYYPLFYDIATAQVSLERNENCVEILPHWNDGFEGCWTWGTDLASRQLQLLVGKEVGGTWKIYRKAYADDSTVEKPKTIWDEREVQTEVGQAAITDLFGAVAFRSPKPTRLIEKAIWLSSELTDVVLDFYAGSGTTGHAVLNLNRCAPKGFERQRRFILVEMGEHFATVLKPRIAKVIYSPDWKDGRAQTHGMGVSALVKYFALESYEDALNNLPAPTGGLLAGVDGATADALITYSLDLELGPDLLNLEAFRDPWGYQINAQPAGEAEIRPHRVDLVETFNYLLGLKVKAYGPLERYSAEFEQAAHAEGLGRVKVKGRLRRSREAAGAAAGDGSFVFQRVEGELNDANGTRVLVVWRKLTENPEQDAAVLEAWMERHREDTRERSEHREYQQIYINGPVTLPQPTAEIRTVYPIEQTFKDRMFEDGGEE